MGVSSDSTVPRRRRSTKQLISQYESTSPGLTNGPPSIRDAAVRASRRFSTFDPTAKDKSPIRHSFRNLLSVFKKANPGKKKQDGEPALSGFRRRHALVLDSVSSVPPVLGSGSHKLSSSLLYLSHTSQLAEKTPILPVWTPCTASLERDRIVISCLTAYGIPSIHTVRLSQCADVRSLSVHQLQPEEISLLPRREGHGEFKVFEIHFEGRPREKFAANTAQERAAWVSAIWDTILPVQEGDTKDNTDVEASRKLLLPPILDHANSMQLYPTTISTASPFSKRSLPPIPDTQPHGLTVNTCIANTLNRTDTCSLASSSVYSPTRTASLRSPLSETRSMSPSVNKLSELSVVRQRLAQIESTSSQPSYMSPTSSKISHSTRLTSPALSAGGGSFGKQDMLRVRSSQSNAADSIVDSYIYGEFRTCTPMDQGIDVAVDSTASKELLDQRISGFSRPFKSEPRPKLGTIAEIPHERKAKADENPQTVSKDQISQKSQQELPDKTASAASTSLDIEKMLCVVANLEGQLRCNEGILVSIHNKLEKEPSAHVLYDKDVVQEFQLFREHISEDINRVRDALMSAYCSTATSHTLNNVSATHDITTEDLSELHRKLDNLISISNFVQPTTGNAEIEGTLAKILSVLENDKTQQSLQTRQQADIVHYLNELNSWLESFVNDGTTQPRDLSANVTHLRQETDTSEGGSAFADIRQLAQKLSSRDCSSVTLQASINELLGVMREQSAALSNVSISTLLGQQRQDYEDLLRVLITEISNEIKGERLRFVEAMKEATAINVQIHVQQFKEELRREVVGMTQEIGRLHQNRQTVQSQIAELNAFHTKHKTTRGNSSDTPHVNPERAGSMKYRLPPLDR